MSAEEPMTADLFEVDKRLALKPVVDFNAYLRNAFGDGPCACYRCKAGVEDTSAFTHTHTFTFDGATANRRFALTAASDVLQVLKKAWLSYTKADLRSVGPLDLDTVKTFTDPALHARLLALLPASGLASCVEGQWQLHALAE